MNKYYVVEVSFTKNKWEMLGEKHTFMHHAVTEMIRIDLTFPTRISKITKEVVLTDEQRRRRGKSKHKRNKATNRKH